MFEPSNRFDSNAHKVIVHLHGTDYHVGYVASRSARDLTRLMAMVDTTGIEYEALAVKIEKRYGDQWAFVVTGGITNVKEYIKYRSDGNINMIKKIADEKNRWISQDDMDQESILKRLNGAKNFFNI